MARCKSTTKNHVIGVDLGGTKVLAAIVSKDGDIIARTKMKTGGHRPPEEILQRVADCCQGVVVKAGMTFDQFAGIGVGSPGPLDPIEGKVIETPNLNLTGAPITGSLEKACGIPAFLDNDVNVGTLGEFTYGAGKDKQSIVGIFLGTGVGGGVIINNQLLHGMSYNAGELGHMKIVVGGAKCGCGQRGCLEAYASKTAMINNFKKAVAQGKKTILTELIGDDWTKLTSKIFRQAIEAKDSLVTKEIKRASKYTGIAVGSLLNILSPELVVIGGGLVEAIEDEIMPLVRKYAKKSSFDIINKDVDIVPAALGDDAGILGAAALAWNRLESDGEII